MSDRGIEEGKPTPRPWTADDGDSSLLGIFGPDGNPLAYLVEPLPGAYHPAQYRLLPIDEEYERPRELGRAVVYSKAAERTANADLIVRAVNSHDVLVASLRECLDEMSHNGDSYEVRSRALEALRAAAGR